MTRRLRTLTVAACLCSYGCASIAHGRTQAIQVTSVPTGAVVFIDGVNVGRTPAQVAVKRRDSGLVLRVEEDGYKPVSINLKRSTSGWIVADILLGASSFPGTAFGSGYRAGAIAASVFMSLNVGIDYLTGAIYKRDPGTVQVVLDVAGNGP